MAKYMTRTVDTYVYHLGNIENNGTDTTIVPVATVESDKKLGEFVQHYKIHKNVRKKIQRSF